MRLLSILTNLALALFVGVGVQMATGLNAYAVGGTIAALSFIQAKKGDSLKGLALMAIQVEIWQKHIEEEIFKDNAFLRLSHNADEFVIGGKVVHIPQSGGSGNVVKNRTSLPATVRKRTDTDVVYVLDELTTDPVLIANADTVELSYDKRNSVLGEDRDKLIQVAAEETMMNWVRTPAYGDYSAQTLGVARMVDTTGDATPATAPAATGNRKKATLNDLQSMQNLFRKEDRWVEGKMYCLLPPDMLTQMFPADSVVTATYMQSVTEQERREGVLYKAQGWKIMSRSSVLRVAADDSIKAPGAVGATTDNEAGLFWYHNAVELALGQIVAFEDLSNPTYYGDLYSFLVRLGGRARRSDFKGIALLRQAAAA